MRRATGGRLSRRDGCDRPAAVPDGAAPPRPAAEAAGGAPASRRARPRWTAGGRGGGGISCGRGGRGGTAAAVAASAVAMERAAPPPATSGSNTRPWRTSVVRGGAGAATAAAAAVGVVAPLRARGPPLGGGTPMCLANGTAAIGHGRGVTATMHAGHTPATVRVGESPRSLAERVGVCDDGGALGGRRAVGRAACSGAPRGAARGALGGAGPRNGRAAKGGRRSESRMLGRGQRQHVRQLCGARIGRRDSLPGPTPELPPAPEDDREAQLQCKPASSTNSRGCPVPCSRQRPNPRAEVSDAGVCSATARSIVVLAVDFVTAARVTGNPKPEELQRCHLACYNTHQDGKGMGSRTKHLTAIAMDKHYPVGDPFEFFHCWEYLSENTNLLVTGAVIGDPVAEVGAGGAGADGQAAAPPVAGPPVVGAADAAPPRQERPQGVKAAKVEKGRKRKLNGTDDGEDKEASAIIARMDKIADSLDMEAKRKKESDQHHRRVQADKLALGAFNALYAGVTLTLPQRVTALNELRKQYLHEAAGVVEDGGERGGGAGAGDGEGEVLVAAAVAAAVGRDGTAGGRVPARDGPGGGGGGRDGGGPAAEPRPPWPRLADRSGCGGGGTRKAGSALPPSPPLSGTPAWPAPESPPVTAAAAPAVAETVPVPWKTHGRRGHGWRTGEARGGGGEGGGLVAAAISASVGREGTAGGRVPARVGRGGGGGGGGGGGRAAPPPRSPPPSPPSTLAGAPPLPASGVAARFRDWWPPLPPSPRGRGGAPPPPPRPRRRRRPRAPPAAAVPRGGGCRPPPPPAHRDAAARSQTPPTGGSGGAPAAPRPRFVCSAPEGVARVAWGAPHLSRRPPLPPATPRRQRPLSCPAPPAGNVITVAPHRGMGRGGGGDGGAGRPTHCGRRRPTGRAVARSPPPPPQYVRLPPPPAARRVPRARRGAPHVAAAAAAAAAGGRRAGAGAAAAAAVPD
ncbi:hypothetical protein BU14_0184s0032 [Porphyra umbilicalis]|uniref:No apical meristem-associated C-terminal domain-containing protein n=1 Tax=Porphyra umbilicalis TaxID=2786 RepID=A0A1X6P779_PORUM|nr:hypothetical protein BU14_0184s0032 [Porphyra umbilicalis]|eukprot:OSX76605.1 hypothetical protein BU14_0184s0032 [Porphyra umbilicalis]